MLTDRDREIIRCVSEHRFLRSTHILSLTSGSRQQVLRRLQLLFHHGYLDRPRAQIDYYKSGSRPMVYSPGTQAVKLLAGEGRVSVGTLDWKGRNPKVTKFFLEHALAVAEALIKVRLSCRMHDLQFVRLIRDGAFKWKVSIRHRHTSAEISVLPDAVFGIGEKEKKRWFFFEADRGTMPIERSTLKQTSFVRKIVAYHQTWRQRLLSSSVARFQVITVTTTPAHADSLMKAAQTATKGQAAGLFLFTDQSTLASHNDFFDIPFLNGRGERVKLRHEPN